MQAAIRHGKPSSAAFHDPKIGDRNRSHKAYDIEHRVHYS
jgi:hypothetical protein